MQSDPNYEELAEEYVKEIDELKKENRKLKLQMEMIEYELLLSRRENRTLDEVRVYWRDKYNHLLEKYKEVCP